MTSAEAEAQTSVEEQNWSKRVSIQETPNPEGGSRLLGAAREPLHMEGSATQNSSLQIRCSVVYC